MTSPPGNYDTIRLAVDTNQLSAAAVNVDKLVKEVGEAVVRIQKRAFNDLYDLKVGWMGETAEEAKDFADRWLAAVSELYGTDKHPERGVLVYLVLALHSVRNNYCGAEESVVQMFSEVGNHISQATASAAANPQSGPDPNYLPSPDHWVTEGWEGAVREIFGS